LREPSPEAPLAPLLPEPLADNEPLIEPVVDEVAEAANGELAGTVLFTRNVRILPVSHELSQFQ